MRLVSVPVALILVAGSLGTNAVMAQPDHESKESNLLLTAEQARGHDAAAYAARFNVSQDDALERAEAREAFAPILDSLEREFPDEFSFAEVQHEHPYSFIVHVVGSGEEVADHVDRFPIASELTIEIRGGAAYSAVQMVNDNAVVHAAYASRGFRSVASAVDPTTGLIEVNVDVGISTDGDLSSAPSLLAADVISEGVDASRIRVTSVDGFAAEPHHTYGGALTGTSSTSTSGCTTGFTIVSGATRGIATAGHCANSRWYNMSGNTYQITYVNQHLGAWGDFQWHTTPHDEYDDFYSDYGYLRDVSGVRSGMAVNDFVCLFGWSSGADYNCDQILNLSVSVTYTGQPTMNRLVAVLGDPGIGGDSGGPWYYGSTAWGLHSGRAWVGGAYRSIFSRASYIDDGMGVSIATS